MKKILFLALGYPNADKQTAIWTDLTTEFHRHGHDILVLAPALDKKKIGLQKEAGVNVLRVTTFKLFNVGIIQKGLANIMLPYQYKNALKKNTISLDFDLIIMPTPPITLLGIAKWLKRKTNAKLYLILRDIFPQNAVDLKMIKQNGIIHRYFRKKEIMLYDLSDKIGCMSQANINYIKKHNSNISHSKLELLPNWENLPSTNNLEVQNNIKEKFGLQNNFIVIFGGNIGKPQKLENIVELAKSCQEISNIIFLIIGSGTEFNKISNLVHSLHLNNIKLLRSIPKFEYNELLKASDIGLISLSENFTIPNFPSKVLSYFGAKKPVLASIDLSTDFGTMLEKTNSGLWAKAGDTKSLKEKLLIMYNNEDLRDQKGNNGYNYMVKELLPEKAYKRIMGKI